MNFRLKIYLISGIVATLVACASALIFFREFESDKKIYLRDLLTQNSANTDAKLELFSQTVFGELTRLVDLSVRTRSEVTSKKVLKSSNVLKGYAYLLDGKETMVFPTFENVKLPWDKLGNNNLVIWPISKDKIVTSIAVGTVLTGDLKVSAFAFVDVNQFISLMLNDDFFSYSFWIDGRFIGGKAPPLSLQKRFLSETSPYAELTEFEQYFVYRYGVDSLNVTALAFTEIDIIYAPIKRFMFYLIGTTFVLLGLGVLLSYVSLNLTFKPLEKLILATTEFAQGKFDISLPKAGKDEIGKLSAAFDKMRRDLSFYIQKVIASARLEQEVMLAQKIQSNYCKDIDFCAEDISVTGRYRSCSETGGDYYGFFDSPEQSIIFFGDVSGHGLSSAMVTASIHGALITQIRQSKLEPSNALFELNEVLIRSSKNMMMTGLLVIYKKDSKQVLISNASHLFPLIKKGSKDPWTVLSQLPKGPPIGFATSANDYKTLSLNSTDVAKLFIYCDGVVETPLSQGQVLGLKGLLKHANSIQRPLADDLIHVLTAEGIQRDDDISLLEIDFTGGKC